MCRMINLYSKFYQDKKLRLSLRTDQKNLKIMVKTLNNREVSHAR
jgi:hypothetical protein